MVQIPLPVVAVSVIAALIAAMAALRPILFKMALRNLLRRRAQSAIVVGGLLIGTAIISSSLVVGDTLEFIFVEDVLDRLDRVDEIVGVETQRGYANYSFDNYTQLASWLDDRGAPVDGVAPALLHVVPVQNIDGDKADQAITFMGIGDSHEAGFGGLVTVDGQGVGTADLPPMAVEANASTVFVWVNERASEELNAQPGDHMRFFFGVARVNATVEGVVRDEGKANWQKDPIVFLRLEDAQAVFGEEGRINLIRISNRGGVGDGVVHTDAVVSDIEAFLAATGSPLKVDPVKREGLDDAEEFSQQVTEIFLIMGTFSIIAGVLLIINIFVMLSEERKAEMGVSRAIGMKRTHLTEAFLFEGAMYVALAAALGTLLGLGLGYMIIYAFGLIFPTDELSPTFHFENESLVVAFSLGVIISLTAVALASWRVSKLNIVRAIRDIPEPRERKMSHLVALFAYGLALAGSVLSLRGYELAQGSGLIGGDASAALAVAGLVCLVLAAAAALTRTMSVRLGKRHLAEKSLDAVAVLIAAGGTFLALAFLTLPATGDEPLALFRISGPPLIILGTALPLAHLYSSRIFMTAGGALILIYILAPIELGEIDEQIHLMFIASGVLLVLGAVMIAVSNMHEILRVLEFLLGRNRPRPVLRTAISYPMGKRSRTGLTLAMFALIIFTVTVISMIQEMQSNSLGGIVETQSGGFDILAYSGSYGTIPMMDQRLEDNLTGQVEAASSATVAAPIMLTNLATGKKANYTMWGVSDLLIYRNNYAFRSWASSYMDGDGVERPLVTREDVWRALQENRSLAVVDGNAEGTDQFTLPGSLFRAKVGDEVLVEDGAGNELRLRIIGVLEQTLPFTRGIFVSEGAMFGNVSPFLIRTAYFIEVNDTWDPKVVAGNLEAEFLQEGLQTLYVADIIGQVFETSNRVLTLMQAYLGIGLLVGIAGLGIITVRSVVERRQEIGALRAIGFTRRMVLMAFLGEVSFIALLGILMGVGLGIVLSYDVYLIFFEDIAFFSVPWWNLALISLISYGATLAATVSPAKRASEIPPAVALRYLE